MITCEMMGRLCNQMFIAATAHSLAIDNEDEVQFPYVISGITPTDKETILHRKTIFRNLNYSKDLSFVKQMWVEPSDQSYGKIEYKPGTILRGYFQSEKYFAHNRQQILDLFRIQEQALNFLNQKYSEIINNKKYVSVHVRRGDYLKYTDFHAIMGKEYYDEAMSRFPKGTKFVFFSDDIEWCKETFGLSRRNIYVENQEDVLDLYLMSKIHNNIIANSSFSWWGAWLSELEDKRVLTPPAWFGPKNTHLTMKDLIPETWEMVE